MAEPVGIGVVGLGFGARVHVPAVEATPTARLAAVCSRRGQSSAPAPAPTYRDWRDLVDDPHVEAVVVATPPTTHSAIARAALSAGKPVLCEKPVAPTASEAWAVAEAAAASGVAALVDFELRAVPPFEAAKAVLADGSVGAIQRVHATWNLHTRHDGALEPSWKDNVDEGGGVLNGFAVHVFDYFEWLVGRIERLQGSIRGRDDACTFHAESGSAGMSAELTLDAAPPDCGHVVVIETERSVLRLANRDQTDYVRGFALELDGRVVSVAEPHPRDGRIPPVAQLIARLAGCTRGTAGAEPCLVDGARAQTLVEALREADATGGRVDVGGSADRR